MSWRLARALETLRDEVNTAHPDRPKAADGTIGDARHQAEKSDHNPNAKGVVTAWDITTADFTVPLAESLRRLGEAGDKRVKYVIYRGQIAGPTRRGWKWRPYSGFSTHFDHIHLSVSGDAKQYDRTDPWFPIPTPVPEDDMPLSDEDVERVADRVFDKLKSYVATHNDMRVLLYGTAPGKDGKSTHPNNLTSIGKAVGVKQ